MANKVALNLPNESEINALKCFLRLLRPLKDITYDLIGKNYVTASMIYPAMHTLIHFDLENAFTDQETQEVPSEILAINQIIKKSLKERFAFLFDGKETEKLFLSLTYLDCRFKSLSFIQNIDERKKKLQLVKEYLVSIHEDLQKEKSIQNSQASSSPETRSTQEANDDCMPSAQPNAQTNAQASPQTSAQPNAQPNASNKKRKDRPSYLTNIVDGRFSINSQQSVNGSFLNELQEYDSEFSFLNRTEEEKEELLYDPLVFYKIYSTKYPLIRNIAKALLCVTGTSVPSECLFSHVGLIATKLRVGYHRYY